MLFVVIINNKVHNVLNFFYIITLLFIIIILTVTNIRTSINIQNASQGDKYFIIPFHYIYNPLLVCVTVCNLTNVWQKNAS